MPQEQAALGQVALGQKKREMNAPLILNLEFEIFDTAPAPASKADDAKKKFDSLFRG